MPSSLDPSLKLARSIPFQNLTDLIWGGHFLKVLAYETNYFLLFLLNVS